MRYLLSTGAMPCYPWGATLALAHACGADGVELLISAGMLQGRCPWHTASGERPPVPILSAHARLRLRGAALDRQIADDCASVTLAAAIPTCEALTVHAPFTGARLSADLNRWLAALSAARDASANPQLHIGIENRPNNGDGAPAQLLDDLERLRRLAGEWGLGVTFDVAHAASCGADLPDAATQLASQLVNVHISDAGARSYRGGLRNGLFRDHRLPGTGILPLAATLTALRRAGYDGLMTLEASPVAVRAWWPVATRRLLRQAFTDLRALGAGLPATSRTHAEPGYPAR